MQIGAGQQLASIEMPVRVDLVFVSGERRNFFRRQKLQLGDADAVLARDHAAELGGQRHDALHRLIRRLQHGVVVGVYRDVGVHIAVTGVHMQRDEYPAAQYFLMNCIKLSQHRLQLAASEKLMQGLAYFALPRHANGVVLQGMKHRVEFRVLRVELQLSGIRIEIR